MTVQVPKFEKNEDVLCFYHELLYDAKILDIKAGEPDGRSSRWTYKIHYKGWKNKWDDWVSQDRLRKLTPANKTLASVLRRDLARLEQKKEAVLRERSRIRTSETSNVSNTESARATAQRSKTLRNSEMEDEDVYYSRPSVWIPLPMLLKSLLVDDWEFVTKHYQLVALPSKTPVSIILQDYGNEESKSRDTESAERLLLDEVVEGLREYFNVTLGKLLLYKYERQQYAEIYRRINDPLDDLAGRCMADIYGAEHLLRLLSVIPELIAHTNMSRATIDQMREELIKFSHWLSLSENIEKYLSHEYQQWSAFDLEQEE